MHPNPGIHARAYSLFKQNNLLLIFPPSACASQNPNLRWLNLARCAIGESDALLCICQITGPRTLPFGIDLRGNGLKVRCCTRFNFLD